MNKEKQYLKPTLKKKLTLSINNEIFSKIEEIAFNKKLNSFELIENILEQHLKNS